METSRHSHHFKAAPGRLFMHQGRGALRVTGGKRSPGRKTHGIWKFSFPPSLPQHMGSIVFLTMGFWTNGLCEVYTTDVCRIARSISFQFSRRRFCAGRIGQRLPHAWHAVDGSARPRWPLWGAQILSVRRKGWHPRAYRRGGRLYARLALSAAGHFTRGIQKSLPPDHTDEASCEKRRRRH